jgi:small GTP-binding protein
MRTALDSRRAQLLGRTRDVLGELRDVLAQLPTAEQDHVVLVSSIRQLDDFFLLVVAGEFNSGKSAFINALLGRELLQEGVTPTTSQIHVLKHGDVPSQRQLEKGVWEQIAAEEILRDIAIVDTPGTNAVLREHEALTAQFIPRSDLVLFITSADRPFTESERAFLAEIRSWGKKIILVVNKIDILTTATDREQVLSFVTDTARDLLGEVQAVFAVSARQAKSAKSGSPELWEPSGFGPLEAYIQETLDDAGRFRLKIMSPLGVALRFTRKHLDEANADLASLSADRLRLGDIEAQTREYDADIRRGFEARLAEIDNLLHAMEQRGNDFFDDTIRLKRIPDLLRTKVTQAAFERDVVADLPDRIDTRVTELIDWLVAQDLRQWTAVADHMAKGAEAYKDRIVGRDGDHEGTLAHNRRLLVESLRNATRATVDAYDERAEAAKIAEAAKAAVVDVGLAGVGAGIGIAVAAAAQVAWLDVTGIVAGVLAATLGLFVLPARRRKAKADLRHRLSDLRAGLVEKLTDAFEREIEREAQRVDDMIAPFARFVRAETDKVTSRVESLSAIEAQMLGMEGELENV